jgi:hypothetical protein
MERVRRLRSAFGLHAAQHVQGDAVADRLLGADSIHGLLHLAVSTVAPLDGVGGGRQQGIVQEDQRLFQSGREELLERLSNALEATNLPAERGQPGQGRIGSAAAVEQLVSLVYDLSQNPQIRPSPRDPLQGASFRRRQVMLDEQVAVVEQAGDLLFDAFLPGRPLAVGCRRPRPNFGSVAFSCRRTFATAFSTALLISAMTWNWQTW